jgi:hypothetical protein
VILELGKLSNPAARFLVANYITAQDARKRCDMQLRHLGDRASELEKLLQWTGEAAEKIEGDVSRGLARYAESHVIGRWMMSLHGVGPIIAAGFLAHLDVTKTQTAGGFWLFAGLDPKMKWETGQKRPYNPDVKQLCYHFGECIKRTSNHPDSFYGRFYRQRKRMIVERNERGEFAERAKSYKTLSSEVRKKLKQGKLPDGNLDRQACNITAKLFLSHLHAVMYWHFYKKVPPKPYSISILGHAHEIAVPNTDEFFPGFAEAYYGRAEAAE